MRYFTETLNIILENLDSKIPKIEQMVLKDVEKPKSPIKRLLSKLGKLPETAEGTYPIKWLAEFFNQFDPTKDKAEYTVWIAKAYMNSTWVLPDDGDTLLDALNKFTKAKKMRGWQGERDINRYPDFGSLYVAVKDLELDSDKPSSLRQWEQKVKSARSQYVSKAYEDNLFTMFIVNNDLSETYDSVNITPKGDYPTWVPDSLAGPDELPLMANNKPYTQKIPMAAYVAASITKMSKNSWCTANPNMARSYLQGGPLHFVYKKSTDGLKPFFLANSNWSEIMDPGQTGNQLPLSKPSITTLIFLIKLVEKEIINERARRNIVNKFYGNGIRDQIHLISQWPSIEQSLNYAKNEGDIQNIQYEEKRFYRNKVAVDLLLAMLRGRNSLVELHNKTTDRPLTNHDPDLEKQVNDAGKNAGVGVALLQAGFIHVVDIIKKYYPEALTTA